MKNFLKISVTTWETLKRSQFSYALPLQQYSEDFKGTWFGFQPKQYFYFDSNKTFSLQSHEQKTDLC